MKKLVHPHCNIVVNIDPWRQAIMDRNEQTLTGFLKVRKELSDSHEKWMRWLIKHGYQLGQDYFRCEEGYRFSSEKLAKEFILGALK
jgi:hypothetical protein